MQQTDSDAKQLVQPELSMQSRFNTEVLMEYEIVRPRKRKYAELYTLYQQWLEINKLRTRISNRVGASNRGDSNADTGIMSVFLDGGSWVTTKTTPSGRQKEVAIAIPGGMDLWQSQTEKWMHAEGSIHPMWDWLNDIKGVAGNNASKFLALVDDIERFPTIASLWRYSGYGIYQYWVNEDGKVVAPIDGYRSERRKVDGEDVTVRWFETAEPEEGWSLKKIADPPKNRRPRGWNAPDNTILKSHIYVMVEGMRRTQQGKYVDAYYESNKRYKEQGLTPAHAQARSFRIMAKEFLKDFWVEFRTREGLPITDEWA